MQRGEPRTSDGSDFQGICETKLQFGGLHGIRGMKVGVLKPLQRAEGDLDVNSI